MNHFFILFQILDAIFEIKWSVGEFSTNKIVHLRRISSLNKRLYRNLKYYLLSKDKIEKDLETRKV